MQTLLYSELVPWYRLIDPVDDHAEEAAAFIAAFDRAVAPAAETLLELGAGAGHNGFHLKERYRCTLTDISLEMQTLSREINPSCEHALGDMRSLRLGRTFDVVLVHDAIVYMLTEADLRAAMETAFVHTRPGGAAIFAPDCVKETLTDGYEVFGQDDEDRALRCLAWTWDQDPHDCLFNVDYAFLLREGDTVKAIHDRHVEGVFPRATWERLLTAVGYSVETFARPIGDGATDDVFLCRRP